MFQSLYWYTFHDNSTLLLSSEEAMEACIRGEQEFEIAILRKAEKEITVLLTGGPVLQFNREQKQSIE